MEDVDRDFCFPCTKCQAGFSSLRDLRKHTCSTEDKLRHQKEPTLLQCRTKVVKVETTHISSEDDQSICTDTIINMEDPVALLSERDNSKMDNQEYNFTKKKLIVT